MTWIRMMRTRIKVRRIRTDSISIGRRNRRWRRTEYEARGRGRTVRRRRTIARGRQA